ncbi:hypothetical protein XEUV684_13350 [Xanthomonas euvesicatoria]|nr:hypothetical protein XEUV684_13350 [Xanthomonas euvesicatoria]
MQRGRARVIRVIDLPGVARTIIAVREIARRERPPLAEIVVELIDGGNAFGHALRAAIGRGIGKAQQHLAPIFGGVRGHSSSTDKQRDYQFLHAFFS